MKTLLTTLSLLGLFATTAVAQTHEYRETSIGTEAPSAAGLLSVIERGTATRLAGALDYGQMVECSACVPALMNRVLTDDNARAREWGAWWLRQRLFGANMAFAFFKQVLATDADPVRRARAAEAIGEFLSPASLAPLTTALGDSDAGVREAAVRGLGRLNHVDSQMGIAAAMGDASADVRLAAVKQVIRINVFRQNAALVGLLTDADARVRREASMQIGQVRLADAAPALAALLRGDEDRNVRRGAAWALGRIGGAEANAALSEAAGIESDSTVLDAIRVAQQM
jgi:HEAT repeat protein